MRQTHKGSLLTEAFLETFKLNGLLVTKGDQLVKDLDLTSARWKILGALSYTDSGITVPDIAREMGQTRQAIQRLVNEMIEDGLLESLDNPKHKRAKLFSLTNKGQEIFSKVMEKQIPWVNSIAQDIREEDLNTVVTTLKYLNTYLDV